MSFTVIPTQSRDGCPKKGAAIDIGSHTLRLLIANIERNQLVPLFRDREIVGLGRNFYPDRILSGEAMDLALQVLDRFHRQAHGEDVRAIRAAGTGVLREADNLAGFIEAVRRETGLEVSILSGEQEARLSALGVLSVFDRSYSPTCIFDLGGGSTEFFGLGGDRLERAVSLPLGVVGLTESFLPSDPPRPEEINRLKSYILEILMKNMQPPPVAPRLIGTAGTVTTVAAMVQGLTSYDPDKINGSVLDRGTLDRLLSNLVALPLGRRRSLPGLEPGRADIIVAGLIVVLTIMRYFNVEELLVSDAGLLEGLLLENPAGMVTAGD